jgi:hypothetical protein
VWNVVIDGVSSLGLSKVDYGWRYECDYSGQEEETVDAKFAYQAGDWNVRRGAEEGDFYESPEEYSSEDQAAEDPDKFASDLTKDPSDSTAPGILFDLFDLLGGDCGVWSLWGRCRFVGL